MNYQNWLNIALSFAALALLFMLLGIQRNDYGTGFTGGMVLAVFGVIALFRANRLINEEEKRIRNLRALN